MNFCPIQEVQMNSLGHVKYGSPLKIQEWCFFSVEPISSLPRAQSIISLKRSHPKDEYTGFRQNDSNKFDSRVLQVALVDCVCLWVWGADGSLNYVISVNAHL